MATIQLPVPSPLITAGDFTANVLDPGSGTPTNVIRTEDPWAVHAEWFLEGPIVPILNGRWRLQVALESIGNQGVEMVSPAVLVPYASGTLTGTAPNERMSFTSSVDFAAGSDSPVSADWSSDTLPSKSARSAATMSPVRRCSTSPGTTSCAGTSCGHRAGPAQ